MSDPLLEVRNLVKHYPITEGLLRREVGVVRAVDGISFSVDRGETLGIVGESGCGKSTAATTLLRLEEPTAGAVYFDGEDVTAFDAAALKRFRRRAQLVFQDPTSSFDPRMSVGESVGEPLVIHGIADRERRRRIVRDLFERVGLSGDDVDHYPHEFSGGQKQRIAIARALVVNPELIVADEPTSALDVSVQADILSLVERIQAAFGLTIVFISHDLGVVREVCDRVAVMYLGEIVELAPTDVLFSEPQHPYTRALLASVPLPDPRTRGRRVRLAGDVPSPADPPSGCRFHTRCPEIIPPEGVHLGRAEWRAVMDLRVALAREGVEPERIREVLAAESEGTPEPGASGESPARVDDRAVTREIRREFGIPEALSDPAAERSLADALETLVGGDTRVAREQLAAAFETPCVTVETRLLPTPAGNGAACHLHDPDLNARADRARGDRRGDRAGGRESDPESE